MASAYLSKMPVRASVVRPSDLTTKSGGASEWDDREKRGGGVGDGRGRKGEKV